MRGLGLTYNNRSCSRVQWLDSTWKLGQLRQRWGMGRRQVSGQQNVSYSTSTRRETRSHVTTDKLTVAYAAQTVSNFGANRKFRTLICLGDTAGKLAGTTERISSPWMHLRICPNLHINTFYSGLYWTELNFQRITLYLISRFYLELVFLPRNGIVFLHVRFNRDWFWLLNKRNQAYQLAPVTSNYSIFELA